VIDPHNLTYPHHPHNPQAQIYSNMGVLAEKRGDKQEALEYVEKVQALVFFLLPGYVLLLRSKF
jgi:hypothetical protein